MLLSAALAESESSREYGAKGVAVTLGCTSICVLIGHLLRLVLWPISDRLIIHVSHESGHGTVACRDFFFFQGQSNAIPEGIDLVSAWAGAPVQ